MSGPRAGQFDGLLQRLPTAAVNSVGKDDKRLAALLLLHQFVGGEVHRIVEKRAAAAVSG